MLTIEKLAQFGANTQEGVQRCMGNEAFYLKLVKMIPPDPNFEKLYGAIDSGDLDAGFEAAHALKGAVGNLSLTPLYDPIEEITELLRGRTETDYSGLVERIRSSRDALAEMCAD